MALDGIFIHALTKELSDTLDGARISKIQQPESEELQITFRTRSSGQKKLLLSANASLPTVYFTEDSKTAPLTAPNFCMMLRKHIGSGRILSVTQPGLERIIDFRFEHLDEMGDVREKHLIAELMGKYSNLIFTDEVGTILDAIRHVPPTVSSVRTVLPGKTWFIPETQGKKDPLTETRESFMESLDPKAGCLKALTGRYIGFSNPTVSEILHINNIDPDRYISDLSDSEKEALWVCFRGFIDEISSYRNTLTLIREDRTPASFSAFPMPSYLSDPDRYTAVTYDSPSALLSDFYSGRNRAAGMKQRSYDTRKTASTLLERASKKYDLQLKQLKDAEKRETYQHYGELLNAWSYMLPVGVTPVKVSDYTDGDREIEIPVDPDLSIADNAKNYFSRYGKLKRTYEALTVQIEETRTDIDHLTSIIQSIDMADSEETLKQIRLEMADAGYIRHTGGKNGRKETIRSKPYHYVSSDGFDIYVGKNNLQNEYLTFKMADGNDIWLHAKKAPGSHVIIKTLGREVPDRTYEEAGALAAYYSSNRNASKVEIDYAEKKFIKKPAAARPGFVIYHTNYSLMAEPDISGLRREE